MNVKLSQIGVGYWGKNLIRNINSLGVLKSAYDLDEGTLNKFKNDPAYRQVKFGSDYKEALKDDEIKGVVIATPPHTHYSIAMDVIKAGKNVFIEKPMTLDVSESEEIVKEAKDRNLIVLVGHIFLYSPEIIKLKEIISSADFGDIQYLYTKRLNLGKIQDCGVTFDLAPHDISIFDYLLEKTCDSTQVVSQHHVISANDVAFISMYYGNTLCHMHLSWLDPLKVRQTVVVGSKQMVVCDSMSKKIKIYNNSVDIDKRSQISNSSYANHLLSYNYGDVISPYIEGGEPMLDECKDFINCIETGKTPIASGELGLSVVRTLDAMRRSAEGGGEWKTI
jgi:UDP-2-acetamido-3-amino-2,3-dideoxy-glucuronate N-acetyltransferase